jgi:putative endonuclease
MRWALKKTSYTDGINAEGLAAEHLQKAGYKVLEQRYKTKHGEIDLIASKNGLIAFVEVKKRKNELLDDPISAKQKSRISNAALQYLAQNPAVYDFEMRFDFNKNLLNYIENNKR